MNHRITTVWPAGNSRGQCAPGVNAIWGVNSLPKSISAGALDRRFNAQPYSSQGPGQCAPTHPTVSVPTFGILPWGGGFLNFQEQGGGTSSAEAIVSGAVALMYSASPQVGTDQIIDLLRRNAAPVFQESEDQIGAGLLQIQRALRELLTSPIRS